MRDLFTDRARLAVYYATEESTRLGENYLGTEHLMLGLLRDEDNVAHDVLRRLHVLRDDLRIDIKRTQFQYGLVVA